VKGKGMRGSTIYALFRGFGLLIGLTSTIFFIYAFFNMAFEGHGVLFYEPNLTIATGEFFMVVIGLIAIFASIVRWIRESA
jgi:hypothetical protein